MCNKIIKFETIDSTNTYGLLNFENLEDKTAIIANEQTKGRGRFNRIWVSGNYENIYLSFILKPQNKQYLANITQYLSVVTSKVIETYNVTPHIKYPNDVLINGKKVCGILCESFMQKNKLQGIVLGIGINLNMPEEIVKSIDRPATSLNLVLKQKINKNEFLDSLLKEFFKNYEEITNKGFSAFKEDYLQRIHFLGKTIWVQQRDGAPKEEVIAKEIDKNGNLIVKTKENKEKIVLSGDIHLN